MWIYLGCLCIFNLLQSKRVPLTLSLSHKGRGDLLIPFFHRRWILEGSECPFILHLNPNFPMSSNIQHRIFHKTNVIIIVLAQKSSRNKVRVLHNNHGRFGLEVKKSKLNTIASMKGGPISKDCFVVHTDSPAFGGIFNPQ